MHQQHYRMNAKSSNLSSSYDHTKHNRSNYWLCNVVKRGLWYWKVFLYVCLSVALVVTPTWFKIWK